MTSPSVVINYGHSPKGVPDCGAVNKNTGLRESDITELIGESVVEILNQVGYNAIGIQSDRLSDVAKMCDTVNAEIMVSIHCDSFTSPSAKGTTSFYYHGSVNGQKLASLIQNQITCSIDTVDRGIKYANFQVLRETDCPACLVETLFISNPDDEKKLADGYCRLQIARAIARGISDYFTQMILQEEY